MLLTYNEFRMRFLVDFDPNEIHGRFGFLVSEIFYGKK